MGGVVHGPAAVLGLTAGASASAAKRGAKRMAKKPGVPRVAESTIDADAAAAAERERARTKRARGRASTILTGPLGDLSTPSLGFKVLTGQ